MNLTDKLTVEQAAATASVDAITPQGITEIDLMTHDAPYTYGSLNSFIVTTHITLQSGPRTEKLALYNFLIAVATLQQPDGGNRFIIANISPYEAGK